MEKPSSLEENFEALATEMVALKYFSGRVMRKKPKRMEGWLDCIETTMNDFIEIRREMKDVDLCNNLEARVKLGWRATESLKAATELKEEIKSIMKSIETSSDEGKTDQPKLEVATSFKKENETSLTVVKGDKIKVVTTHVKVDKPMPSMPADSKRHGESFKHSEDMKVLEKLRSEITEKKAPGWIETVDSKAKELDELQNQIMVRPSKSKATIRSLQSEIAALKRIVGEMDKVGDKQIDPWLEDVKSMVGEVAEIIKEADEIYIAFDPNNLTQRIDHEMKVAESVKAVITLKERAVEMFVQSIPEGKMRRFSSDELNSFISRPLNKIGYGGSGDVYKGQFADGVQVAVKVLKSKAVTEETFLIELSSMLKASHPNIIKLYGFCSNANTKALVYEFMENGSVEDLFKKPDLLEWQAVYTITVQIAKALAYLHHGCDSGQIIHHDAKPANVLLDTNFSAKVAGFGAARIVNKNVCQFTMSKFRGTPGYIAPEINPTLSKVSYKCDVYSFGMILFNVLGMRSSNESEDLLEHQVWNGFKKGNLDEIIKNCGISDKDALKARILSMVALWCIQHTPEGRPSMTNVVNALEKEKLVRMPPNPFYLSKGSFSMQDPQDLINSSISSSTDKSYIQPRDITLPLPGMVGPSRLLDNWELLTGKLDVLLNLRDEVENKMAQEMATWLENVNDKEKEFEALQFELSMVANRAKIIKFALNSKVLGILSSINALHQSGIGALNATETLLNDDLSVAKKSRFTDADIKKFTSDFSTLVVGHHNENVYKGQFPSGVRIVVQILADSDVIEQVFMTEVNKMLKTSHRNVVRLYGFCFQANMKALVFEYMPHGSLDRILFDNHRENIDWERLYNIATDTAKGVSYLHDGSENQLLHLNIMPSNVLLDSSMRPKVSNFGMWKLLGWDQSNTMTGIRGDPGYSAPELIHSTHKTHKSDVYSFGMLLFEVLGRQRNFRGRLYFPTQIWKKVANKEVEQIIKECNIPKNNREKAIILCMVGLWCIQYTPENRPSMSTVVKMLEKEIKVLMPPDPFLPSVPYSLKPFVDVVYDMVDMEPPNF